MKSNMKTTDKIKEEVQIFRRLEDQLNDQRDSIKSLLSDTIKFLSTQDRKDLKLVDLDGFQYEDYYDHVSIDDKNLYLNCDIIGGDWGEDFKSYRVTFSWIDDHSLILKAIEAAKEKQRQQLIKNNEEEQKSLDSQERQEYERLKKKFDKS